MNPAPTKQPSPTSVAALRHEVAALHRSLAEAQRARAAARASQPRLIVEGDETALAESYRASRLAERDVANFSATLAGARAALRLARRTAPIPASE